MTREMVVDIDLDLRGASRMTGKKLILIFTQSNQLIGGFIWARLQEIFSMWPICH